MADADAGADADTGWLLARASHALAGATATALRSEGVSLRGYVVLSAAVAAPLSQQALAASVGLDKTTMVAAVDELEAAGLVERTTAPGDRRVRLVVVTPTGRSALDRARARVRRTEDDLLAGLGDERAVLRRLLLAVLDGALGAHAPGGSCV